MDATNKKNQKEPVTKEELKPAQAPQDLTFEPAPQSEAAKLAKLPLIDTEFDEDLDEESLRMFDKYEINKKFLDSKKILLSER